MSHHTSYHTFAQYANSLLKSEHQRRYFRNVGHSPVAMVFPQSYSVGMSSLGYQTVVRLFAETGPFHCERAFLYDDHFSTSSTLETQKSLRSFHFVGFSLSYELDYPAVLTILTTAGIPIFSRERQNSDPVVLLGGVSAFYNPSVLAPVADAIFIGEAEDMIAEFVDTIKSSDLSAMPRNEILHLLARIEGIYVPAVHGYRPPDRSIKKRHLNTRTAEPSTSIFVTAKAHLNMFLTEVGRGCGRGCRFCAAGHVYHPFRLWNTDSIINVVKKYAHPQDRIGLVGAALSDFRELDVLCARLFQDGYKIGLSSLRIDRINNTLLDSIQGSDIRTLTLAPETGSEKLRRIINKPLSDAQILSAVELIASYDVRQLKLYYMIGLPFENFDDIEAIVKLTKQIAQIFFRGRGGREIRVSVNAFIPKPLTPFQWAPMAKEKELRARRNFIHKQLYKIRGVHMAQKSSKDELLQAVLSMGDSAMTDWLVQQAEAHVRAPIVDKNMLEWIYREKEETTIFPWDFIDSGVEKAALWNSWMAAQKSAGH